MFALTLFLLFCAPLYVQATGAWIDYPADGTATMTHYTIPDGFIAACGCTGASTVRRPHLAPPFLTFFVAGCQGYPTAAMSQMAYGSSTAFGPACGKCFNLTLLNTYTSDPPFFPDVVKSIVIKVTDLCPLSEAGWCSGTQTKKNPGGQYINFDMAFPSKAIPDDFFPSNASYYGYTDFGVWNVSYQTVPCLPNWAGAKNKAALGSVTNLGNESVCCPANPTGNPNDTCPSYSDDNALPYVVPLSVMNLLSQSQTRYHDECSSYAYDTHRHPCRRLFICLFIQSLTV
ncbi:RlpA-like double-psi beta-barrel-protein domain-containing protein-containing protein [Mycena metata]|uniref:RlpA-like double-psi beta-barrel-protein domain-containing protein-containing protein n=1 Tax=Mycena metata TaxID=1033252 RepID=A0AAD7P142_9AGAR|nr:RlpA-like double-psi beta-barrel-protein domain-containing protein-containing protein [Mycena metata]